ncbi:MAG: peptidase M23 [Bacteroidota bacterium]
MKNKVMILAATGLIAGCLFTNCKDSSEHKVENASENVADAQKDLDKAEQEFAEEWEKFRLESEERIRNNDNEIARYREMEKNDKTFRKNYEEKVTQLEARNAELKAKMAEDKNTRRENWAEFKREFNHDMDELGAALKDITKDNKD